MHILVIEDDPILSNMLRLYLEKEGYRISLARDGRAGLDQFRAERADLILLDVMLPGLDGLEVCQQIRSLNSQVPIIMLTALDAEQQKIKGLDLGADDYVTKPFSMAELMARLRAHLRRTSARGGSASPSSSLLVFPGLEVDPVSRRVALEGRFVDLTPKEFDLLYLMAREPERVFTRDELLQRIWNYPQGTDPRTLHTHVLRLRRKLEGAEHSYLQTVWGVGFKFMVARA